MAGGGFYFVCVISHVSNLRLIIVFCSSSSSCRLRGLSADLTAHNYVTVYSVDCYGPDISYFHSILRSLVTLAALQACVYLPPFRWLPVRLG